MLKPMLFVCMLFLCPPQSGADTELARDWSRTAAALSGEIQNALAGDYLDLSVEDDLARFAVTASRLARDFNGVEGAEDLACIFRGMAEDTDLQLRLLHMPGERQSALRRLATMLHDAERIGLAASTFKTRVVPEGSINPTSYSCTADPEGVYQYLTEQP